MSKTCDVCGEQKEEFCDKCQDEIAQGDGLLIDTCSDCCAKRWQIHDQST